MGAVIARALGARGFRVAIGARRGERLDAVAEDIRAAGAEVFAHPLDVAQADSVEAFCDATEAELGAIEVAVSNAGICHPALAHDTLPGQLEAQVAINLLGPMYLARRVIPAMRARAAGDLVFISSESARIPRPYQAAYSASKAGLEAFAQTLTMELEGSGVRVSTIRMGPTATEFGHGWEPELLQRILASWKHFGLQRHLAFLPPEVVADAVVNAVTAPRGAVLATIELQPEAPQKTGPC
jgi:NAD(P)-dependent dehydrogenase (short-subunit alcohol dehydrogenase family)